MAWNDIKVNIPGVGERAYIWMGVCIQNAWCNGNPPCTPKYWSWSGCHYLFNHDWNIGSPLHGIYPNVGDWFTYAVPGNPTNPGPPTTQCRQVLEIIDETMYNNGTCTTCPAGNACNNCPYIISQNPGSGVPIGSYSHPQIGDPGYPLVNGIDFTAGTTSNCSNCVQGSVVNPSTSSNPDCCGPHGVLYAGRNTEVFIPTNVAGGGTGGWVLPDNNIIPIIPDDIGLPYCGFRGLNEPISNGNLIVSPIYLWDDPMGWNQSSTTPQTTNSVDVHSFNQYISLHFPYYDKISNQSLASFLDAIMVIPITGHTSLTTDYLANVSMPPNPLPPYYQEDLRGTGCPCSGDPQTAIISNSCAGKTFFDTSILDPHPLNPLVHYSHMGSGQQSAMPTYYNTGVMDLWLTAHTTTPVDNMTFDGGPAQLISTGAVGCPAPGYAVGSGHDLNTEPLMQVCNFGKKPTTTYYVPGAGYSTTTYPGNMVPTSINWGNVSKQPWQTGYETWEMKIAWLNGVSTQEGWLPPYMGLPFTTAMNYQQVNSMMKNIMSDQIDQGNILQSDWAFIPPNPLNPYGVWPFNVTASTQVRMSWFQFCECTMGVSPTAPTTDVMLLGGFELTEKYITSGVSGFGTRLTNVLASGSWDIIRNYLYSHGMPTNITDYANARPWFEDATNLTSVLQIHTNPLAYPDNAPNIAGGVNDVYLVNKSLDTRCPWNIGPINGCTDITATNYNVNATANCDGTNIGTTNTGWNTCCNYVAQGCGAAVCWDCDPASYTCFVSSTGPYSSLQQCVTACTECECIKVIGTGHTGGYHWTHQTQCENDCCDGPSIKICDVLIVGDDEGVLHYDVTTNVATHLFSDNYYDKYDIAVSYDKLWVYTQCFVAGTLIETSDGQMTIEQIKTGDIVKTFNTDTNQVETATVTETFIHPHNSNRLIINNKINTTPEHPFYIDGKWVEASNLKVGDELLYIDESKHKITSIESDTTNQTVYNFEVEGTHTYFAEGYLVHNKQNQTQIKEYDITLSPFTLNYNRLITIPNVNIGKGLTWYGPNKLVCANTKVQTVDITGNIGTMSTLFNLPAGMTCTGDLLYTGSVGNTGVGMFIVLYNSGTTHNVGKFTVSGQLIQEAIIPNTVLTGTSYFDSLFVDANTDAVYGITNDARVYELEQNPVLQFAPVPTNSTPIPLTNNVTGLVYGADNVQWPSNLAQEMSCASGITTPISYNCQINPQLNLAGCIDPGNGTGTYTGATALADCQNQSPTANPPGCIITWNCDPGTTGTECQMVNHYLPWPGVWDKTSALTYIAHPAMGLQQTPFDQISYEGASLQPGHCFVSTNGGSHPQWRVTYFKCPSVSTQNMYHWGYFIIQCQGLGINVTLSDTLQSTRNKIALFFNIPGVSVLTIYTSPCICTAKPCDCYPVIGLGGMYTTEAACDALCCPSAPCNKCCTNKFGMTWMLPANTFPCNCPGTAVQVPCGPKNSQLKTCYPTDTCALGHHWSYTSCRCVVDQRPCPWGFHWDEYNGNCSPNNMKREFPSKGHYDEKSIDWTLARGVLDIEASAITTTNTLFSTTTGGVIETEGPGSGPVINNNTSGRWRLNSDNGCVQCEANQTEDYYSANNCIYTDSTCNADSTFTYYVCSRATNPVVGESQQACIPQDIKPEGAYYDSLESCLNSGCAGFMWCEFGQSVNGVRFGSEGEYYSPIPMCCSSVIETTPQGSYEYTYTESGPLTVDVCLRDCGKGETWFPLYNAFGTNTHLDSPLAYLTRELLLQVNIGQCTVDTTDTSFRELGYIKKNPYG